jgi:hypothetical protein
MVAVMDAGVLTGAQVGAVQTMRLALAPFCAVPKVPMLAIQEKVSELFRGSLAHTSKVSC